MQKLLLTHHGIKLCVSLINIPLHCVIHLKLNPGSIIFLSVLNNLFQKWFLFYMIHSYLWLGSDYLLFPSEDCHFHINATELSYVSLLYQNSFKSIQFYFSENFVHGILIIPIPFLTLPTLHIFLITQVQICASIYSQMYGYLQKYNQPISTVSLKTSDFPSSHSF